LARGGGLVVVYWTSALDSRKNPWDAVVVWWTLIF
jgi:hypothetical protein